MKGIIERDPNANKRKEERYKTAPPTNSFVRKHFSRPNHTISRVAVSAETRNKVFIKTIVMPNQGWDYFMKYVRRILR
jgi:hypothetical protein